MHWHTWNDEAFARAAERGTPVLVLLEAAWSRPCRDFRAGPLADPEVARALSEHCVLVAVDKDESTEVDRALRGSGWPTLAWLDSERRVLHRSGAVNAGTLVRTAEALAAGRSAPAPLPAGEGDGLTLELADDVLASLVRSADPVHGGWGKRQKFSHPEALHFAMVRWSQTGDPDTLNLVTRTLDRMQHGAIFDSVEGGFFRYAGRADWGAPHPQKLLAPNALRLQAYVEAHQALGDTSFAATAERIVEWMQDTLLDPETGAYRASQDEDENYFAQTTRAARAAHGAPDCDARIVTSSNAHAICALLKGGLVLDNEEWTSGAIRALDFLQDNLVDERRGVHSYWDGSRNLPGQLEAAAALLRAMVEAVHYAGENRFLEPALALAERTLADHAAPDGSLYERLDERTAHGDPGERTETLPANSAFASALLRLGHLLRREDLVERARGILSAFAGDYRRYAQQAAGYGRAVDLLFHPPVHVLVVGDSADDTTRALRRAALLPYVASRVVQSVDPAREPELASRLGLTNLPAGAPPTAYLEQGTESYASTTDPTRLPSLMTRLERA